MFELYNWFLIKIHKYYLILILINSLSKINQKCTKSNLIYDVPDWIIGSQGLQSTKYSFEVDHR